MTPFTNLTAIAAPLPLADVDTDKIIPGRFLKTTTRTGLGGALFYALRYDEDGAEQADFVLNRAPYRDAKILIADRNFGCGSSREHAPWALLDFGIRCIIAPSFADIFFANCFKNGILPIALPSAAVAALLRQTADPAAAELAIDLPAQTISSASGVIGFDIRGDLKRTLLDGRDEIALSLASEAAIAAYEQAHPIPAIHWPPASERP